MKFEGKQSPPQNEIAQTLSDPAAVQEELRSLLREWEVKRSSLKSALARPATTPTRVLSPAGVLMYIGDVATTRTSAAEATDQQRRLDLARRAFKQFYAQCFWSYREDMEITEEKIPLIIRGLCAEGGLAGYRVAAELCQ